MIFTSPLGGVRIPDTPLTPYVLARAADFGSRTAFIDGMSGRTLSYAAFDDAIPKSASGKILRRVLRDEAGL